MADVPLAIQFQPTLPARGATFNFYGQQSYEYISTHAPRTGSDGNQTENIVFKRHFNPRSPHGERLRRATNKSNQQDFNPRSPHGERPVHRNTIC